MSDNSEIMGVESLPEEINDEEIIDTPLLTQKQIKLNIKETYAILIKGEDPFVGEINAIEGTKAIIKTKDKEYNLLLDENGYLVKNDTYEILDIERVIPFDLSILKEDVSQVNKVLTSDIINNSDISVGDIKEKEIIYTDIELREELLSSLVSIFDAYDSLSKITKLNEYIKDFFSILRYDKQRYLYLDSTLPDWLIPIVDNPIQVYPILGVDPEYSQSLELVSELSELSQTTGTDYYHIYRSILDKLRPINPSISDIGYTTHNIRKYLRDCLIDAKCNGFNGNYTFDKRNNKLNYMSNSEIIHKSDTLNIIGLLYLPDSELIQCLDVMNKTTIHLSNKITLQNMISKNYYKIVELRKKSILPVYIEDELITNQSIDQLVSYLFSKRINSEKFFEIINKLTPSPIELIKSVDKDIVNKLLNYDDIRLLLVKYGLDMNKLSNDSKKFINKLITDNYKQYIKDVDILPEIILSYYTNELTINYKITKAKEIIFNMNSIAERNEYLQKFIKLFTREPRKNEDSNSLYNLYTNQCLLCKHYLFSSKYHTDPNIHSTMLTIYGKPPEDGVIYCKHCGEYLCDEEFSAFDGFVNEAPIQIREVMKEDIQLLDNYNEELILLVKQISTVLGVTIKDEDIDVILSTYNVLNQDKILTLRYQQTNLTDTYPLIADIKKKYSKDKQKKEKIKNELKKLQVYFKDTNKLLSLISLIILTIQTSIPSYKNKYSEKLDYIIPNGELLESITYNKKVIDYCIVKLDKLAMNLKDSLWMNYKQLSIEEKNYDLITVKNQIHNLSINFITPQFNNIQTRIKNYINFISGSTTTYIRDEWTLYKPLRNNKDINKIDTYIQSKEEEFKPYYILNYNNYPIENVSMIQSLNESNNKFIKEIVNIPVSEIMINKAFLLIFRLTLSNYGIYKGSSKRTYLHINQFLNTISNKEVIKNIFTNNGYSEDKFISFKQFRSTIIPKIIEYYQKEKQILETCFSNSDLCNRFIHINMNNYDYFMLKAYPKRFYSYSPPRVYPYKDFDDLNEDFITKLFRIYCKDPTGKIIRRNINTSYLGKVLLVDELNVEFSDTNHCEINLSKDKQNFKQILNTIQSQLLQTQLYIEPKDVTYDDFKEILMKQSFISEIRILELFKSNNLFQLDKDHPVLEILQKTKENKLQGVTKELIIREYDDAFDKLIIDDFITAISLFISQVQSSSHKKRFESIFINTTEYDNLTSQEREQLESGDFRYRNLRQSDIAKLIIFFSGDKRLTPKLILNYIHHLKIILSRLKNNPNICDYIPKQWKLDDVTRSQFKKYASNNAYYLYQDLFKLQVPYTGYLSYIGEHMYVFKALYLYIEPYLHKLNELQQTQESIVSNSHMLIISRYILLFLMYKLVDFHNKVKENDPEIMSLLEECIDSQEEVNIPTVEQFTEFFIMDYVSDIFRMHYDSKWVVSNYNLDDLSKRLSKQKEKEKQTLIHKLDTMSDEKRLLTMEKQKSGVINFFKTSGQENVTRVIDEYKNSNDDERYSMFNNLLSSDNIIDEVNGVYSGELPEDQTTQIMSEIQEEEGYIDINEIDEDGQMGDEIHEFHDEDLLDNEYN